jgi:hypothetical protein
MQKITSHLWFDKEAKEAAEFYTSVFKDSEIKDTTTLHNTPSGTVDLVTIELVGQEFRLISAGPLFKTLQLCHFWLPAARRKKSMRCGRNSPTGVRRSWSLANIRSVKDMDGCRTGTAYRGR